MLHDPQIRSTKAAPPRRNATSRRDGTARTSKLVLGFPPVLRGGVKRRLPRRPQRRLTTPASAAASVPDMPAGISPDPPVLSPTDMWVHEPSRAPCIDEEDDDSRRTALCRCGDQPSSDPNGPVKQPPDLGPPGPSPACTPMGHGHRRHTHRRPTTPPPHIPMNGRRLTGRPELVGL